MKSLVIILAAILAMAVAQRGSFAGSRPIGYPGLAARFGGDSSSSSNTNLNNRFNNNDNSNQRIPIDARGDFDLVDRIKQKPRETWPFWLLNADHIEAQRNPQQQYVSGY